MAGGIFKWSSSPGLVREKKTMSHFALASLCAAIPEKAPDGPDAFLVRRMRRLGREGLFDGKRIFYSGPLLSLCLSAHPPIFFFCRCISFSRCFCS
ncbi:hypothetical protein NPIL_678821 [Nephila pilipes]|uniref:Uncharacterized protein n=1 Tax=Nephila pilipes TaxID=299642 RepID=A0A8X6M9I5_NEPPI|nr:hypothetical protein NPIL_202361 [Nephila pilipes]GFT43969.1 hypothetical protein NPIL_133941 [Nephila pilipes]GFT85132.1 hypothetical protein NPIL_678821 [Nephila pilipes]